MMTMTPQSKINKKEKSFEENQAYFKMQMKDFLEKKTEILKGGKISAKKKHLEKGKLLVRQRLKHLLDPGSDFLELSLFAGYQLYNEPLPAAGLVAGIGFIHEKACMIIANDATVKGGTYYPITIKKQLRAQEIAEKNNLPCIYLIDSGGAFLPKQDEVFADKLHFGRIFFNQAKLSAKGIPQIAVVMGSCTAGGAYVPAMADQTIMVKGHAHLFLAGPPLVKAATGEIVTAKDLGGAELHCFQSGVADYYAKDDIDALRLTRHCVNYLPKKNKSKIMQKKPLPPRYPAEEIYGIINHDPRHLYDVHEIIWRLVDDSAFHPFKASYGRTLACGFAHIKGFPVGIIANNGILFSESALKGCHFIQLCCQQKTPLIFLQNVNGFMVGKKYEQEGIAKHGAKMVKAVACAEVPKFTVIIGGSFGAGNYAMCGRAYDPHFLWIWPNTRIGIMGGKQAANVLNHIQKNSKNSPYQKIEKQYETQSHPYYASARLWDDGIIDPANTRNLLAWGLSLSMTSTINSTQFGLFRM